KAKSQGCAPRRTGSNESDARLRVRFVDRGRQHSLAHQASARLKTRAAGCRLVGRCRPGPAREALRRKIVHRFRGTYPRGRCLAAPYQKPSLEQKSGLKDGPPLGLETAAPVQPRSAQALGRVGKRWSFPLKGSSRAAPGG